ncbi:phage holin family protein [Variovorax paradoxus]|uniref:phage holin family protein n=1 Tax=Variovorax paradoxus TaxID=34073 RepID=UPI001ABC2C74
MRLLSLLGLDRRLRRLRIAAAEGAMAAEDRVQLLRMAWEEEKQRLKLVLVLAIVLLGLTTIAVALLSVAVVVHFWDTPQRTTAAWSVAALWIVLWLAAAWGLWTQLRGASNSFTPTREELARDWTWVQERFGLGDEPGEEDEPAPRRPATREELIERIERQRLRIATLQGGGTAAAHGVEQAAPPPPDETPTATALRIAREHPVATGVAVAAALVVVRPKRLLRWATFVAPILWRMR